MGHAKRSPQPDERRGPLYGWGDKKYRGSELIGFRDTLYRNVPNLEITLAL